MYVTLNVFVLLALSQLGPMQKFVGLAAAGISSSSSFFPFKIKLHLIVVVSHLCPFLSFTYVFTWFIHVQCMCAQPYTYTNTQHTHTHANKQTNKIARKRETWKNKNYHTIQIRKYLLNLNDFSLLLLFDGHLSQVSSHIEAHDPTPRERDSFAPLSLYSLIFCFLLLSDRSVFPQQQQQNKKKPSECNDITKNLSKRPLLT